MTNFLNEPFGSASATRPPNRTHGQHVQELCCDQVDKINSFCASYWESRSSVLSYASIDGLINFSDRQEDTFWITIHLHANEDIATQLDPQEIEKFLSILNEVFVAHTEIKVWRHDMTVLSKDYVGRIPPVIL